jgi:hypothetical protein
MSQIINPLAADLSEKIAITCFASSYEKKYFLTFYGTNYALIQRLLSLPLLNNLKYLENWSDTEINICIWSQHDYGRKKYLIYHFINQIICTYIWQRKVSRTTSKFLVRRQNHGCFFEVFLRIWF